MFWIFLLLAGLACVFTQLGAYSVWVAILTGGFRVALLVMAIFAIVILWQKISRKNV